MQRVALSPRWPIIQTSHHRHLLSFTTTPLTHFKTCGIFFKNLNVFSSGAKLKSIWLVVEKIWNVSNISPAPAWLLAPSPLPFVLVLLRSVLFCVLLRCPIGKTSNISNCRRPASWCDQEAPDSGGWRWLVTINVFVVFADPPFR